MDYMRSKMPLKMMLILIAAVVVNFGLILGLQVVLNYRVIGPIDEAALAKLDKAYEGCTILDHTQNTDDPHYVLHVFLVRKPDGTEHLVTLRKHFMLERYRIVKKACVELPAGEESVTLRSGTTSFTIGIGFNAVSGETDIHWDDIFSYRSSNSFRNTILLYIAGLCAVELAVWCLVFRKEEIA